MTKLKRNKKRQETIKEIYILSAVIVFGIWAKTFHYVMFTGA